MFVNINFCVFIKFAKFTEINHTPRFLVLQYLQLILALKGFELLVHSNDPHLCKKVCLILPYFCPFAKLD